MKWWRSFSSSRQYAVLTITGSLIVSTSLFLHSTWVVLLGLAIMLVGTAVDAVRYVRGSNRKQGSSLHNG